MGTTTISHKRVLAASNPVDGLRLSALRALVEQANALCVDDDALVLNGHGEGPDNVISYLEVVES